jgi:hypothetical protein
MKTGISVLVLVFAVPLIAQVGPAAMDASVGLVPTGQVESTTVLPRRSDTYGTSHTSYVRIDATEMSPESSQFTYDSQNSTLRYQNNAANASLRAPLHLPSGALITYLELAFLDDSSVGEVMASLLVCDKMGDVCTAFTGDHAGCSDLSSFALCSGVPAAEGFSSVATDMSGDGIVIDNFNKRYLFRIGNTTVNGTTALSEIIVGYQLQVSAPPGSPSFNDVPTDHPFFRYIEALAASGVTGGCGSGNYCPDAPVTRGQMAVFLSKALGLQFN